MGNNRSRPLMDLSLSQKILAGSGAFAISLGAMAVLNAKAGLDIVDPKGTITGATESARFMIAGAMTGWGVGKLTAVAAGDDAVANFCKYNIGPMLIGMYGAFKTKDNTLLAMNSAFAVVYGCIAAGIFKS